MVDLPALHEVDVDVLEGAFGELFQKRMSLLRPSIHSKIMRVMKIAQNSEVKIPMISVVANPWIGPYRIHTG